MTMTTNTAHKRPCPSTLDHVAAPNGRPVAENFRAWFRDSKVVDSSGRPLVVYHGTDRDFDGFNKDFIGDNFGADEKGFFFLSNPREASEYAEADPTGTRCTPGANVIAAYISLQRPLIIDDELLEQEGMEVIGVRDDLVTFWDTYQGLLLEWAEERRADGIVLVDRASRPGQEPSRMVVAFEPHQIKSALGNSGLYTAFSNKLSDTKPAAASRPASRQRQKVRP